MGAWGGIKTYLFRSDELSAHSQAPASFRLGLFLKNLFLCFGQILHEFLVPFLSPDFKRFSVAENLLQIVVVDLFLRLDHLLIDLMC